MDIYEVGTHKRVENPDANLQIVARNALARHRKEGRPIICFTPWSPLPSDPLNGLKAGDLIPAYYIHNPDPTY